MFGMHEYHTSFVAASGCGLQTARDYKKTPGTALGYLKAKPTSLISRVTMSSLLLLVALLVLASLQLTAFAQGEDD